MNRNSFDTSRVRLGLPVRHRPYWTSVLRMFRKAYFFWWMPGQWVTASVVMMRLIFIQVVVPWLLLVALSPLIVLAVAYAFFAGLL